MEERMKKVASLKVNSIPIEYGKLTLPANIKEIFLASELLAATDGVIGPALYTWAFYPILDYAITGGKDDREKWEDFFENHLFLTSELGETGLDYLMYGNSFKTVYFKKENVIVTRNQTYDVETVKDLSFKVIEFGGEEVIEVRFRIPGKHELQKGFLRPIGGKSPNKLKVYRWNPYFIDIDWIESAQFAIYYYIIPKSDITRVNEKDPLFIKHIPYGILKEIIKGSRLIQIPRRTMFHFKRMSPLSLFYPGWGLPITTWAMKEAAKKEILSKAQIKMIIRYAMPFIVFFPQPLSNLDPLRSGLHKWTKWIRASIKRFAENPGAPQYSPIPLGVQVAGPTVEQLTLTQEEQASREVILNSLDMLKEFAWGGGSYTSAAHASRVMSNKFSSYIKSLSSYLNYLIQEVSSKLGWEPIKIRFQEVKLPDETSKLQILMELAQNKYISPYHVLKAMGIHDYKREVEQIKDFLEEQAEISEKEQELQMQVQAKLEETAGQQFNPMIAAQIIASLLLQKSRAEIEQYFAKIQQVAPEFGELVAHAMDEMSSNMNPSQKEAVVNEQENKVEEPLGGKPEEEKIKARE